MHCMPVEQKGKSPGLKGLRENRNQSSKLAVCLLVWLIAEIKHN